MCRLSSYSSNYKRSRFQFTSVALFIFLITNLTGCGPATVTELRRVTDPSGQIDAIVLQSNRGATDGWGVHVAIVKKGESIYYRSCQINSSSCGDGRDVFPTWKNANTLSLNIGDCDLYEKPRQIRSPNGGVIEIQYRAP